MVTWVYDQGTEMMASNPAENLRWRKAVDFIATRKLRDPALQQSPSTQFIRFLIHQWTDWLISKSPHDCRLPRASPENTASLRIKRSTYKFGGGNVECINYKKCLSWKAWHGDSKPKVGSKHLWGSLLHLRALHSESLPLFLTSSKCKEWLVSRSKINGAHGSSRIFKGKLQRN